MDADSDSEVSRERARREAYEDSCRRRSRREVLTVAVAAGSVAAIYLALVIISGRGGTADDYWRASRR